MKVTSICLLIGVCFTQGLAQEPNKGANTLIVGGRPVIKNEIPHQIALFRNGIFICGGSILDESNIVTAAHCLEKCNHVYAIGAGEHNLFVNEDTDQNVPVSRFFIHEGYGTGNPVDDDIAILRLATKLTFGTGVQAIALPEAGHITEGIVQTSGWGAQRENGTAARVLRKVDVPIVDDAACARLYSTADITIDGERMICAGDIDDGGIDSCQGDSGGPLTASDNGVYLAGVVSFGIGCARRAFPGVYTEVVHYRDWINDVIRKPTSDFPDYSTTTCDSAMIQPHTMLLLSFLAIAVRSVVNFIN